MNQIPDDTSKRLTLRISLCEEVKQLPIVIDQKGQQGGVTTLLKTLVAHVHVTNTKGRSEVGIPFMLKGDLTAYRLQITDLASSSVVGQVQ